MIDLPIIGQLYTWQEILEITKSRGMTDVVSILENHPPPDKPFKSDGCSCCQEKLHGVELTPFCIEHDIRYWCGLPGDNMARLDADMILMEQVAHTTNDYAFARSMFSAVSVGGMEWTLFQWRWGFGRK